MAMLAGSLVLVGAASLAIVRSKPWQGTGFSVLSLVLLGVLVGGIAKAILPGSDPGGIIVTMLVGLVGALGMGLGVKAALGIDTLTGFFGLHTWLTGVAGSTILLVVYRRLVLGQGRGMAMLVGSLCLVGTPIWAIVRFQPWHGMGGLSVLGLVVLGGLVGGIAKAILPGDDPGGIIVTIIIGTVGTILGGFLAQVIFGRDNLDGWFDFPTWLIAVIGAIILLIIYRMAIGSGRGRRRVI